MRECFRCYGKPNILVQRHYTYFYWESLPINNTTLHSHASLQLKMFFHFHFCLNFTTKSNYELCLFSDNETCSVTASFQRRLTECQNLPGKLLTGRAQF